MITGQPFPLGVICNIYCPLMFSISTDGAFEAVASVCALWFLDQQIEGRKEKGSYMSLHLQLADRLLGWLCCTRALFVVWRAMHYGTVRFYRTQTHTNMANFLDRKYTPYTTTKDTALPCLLSEVKRILFRHPWVCVCVYARVSPTLAQNEDICRPGCTDCYASC